MTTIVFEKDKSGRYLAFTCMGHVGYSKKRIFVREPDIVCSAVSALTFHTLNGLSEIAGEEISVSENEETGFIRCLLPEELKPESIVLLKAYELSLKELSGQYGDRFVKIQSKEVE